MQARLATWVCRAISAIAETIDHRILPAERERKTLYLTFDDGPTERGTERLLDVLARNDAPAMFFLVGQSAERYPELVRKTLDEGHAVGNHSDTHIDAWRASRAETLDDFARGAQRIEQVAGQPVDRMRPPYGRVTLPLVRWAKKNHQRFTLWDAMPPDFRPKATVEAVSRRFLRGVRNGSIVCLHDNERSARVTPGVLELCLPQLRKAGWTFAVLPEAVGAQSALVECTGTGDNPVGSR